MLYRISTNKCPALALNNSVRTSICLVLVYRPHAHLPYYWSAKYRAKVPHEKTDENKKFFTIAAEHSKNALYIIAFITAISTFLTYILNTITAPPVDYIYTVVKKSNPVKKEVKKFEAVINNFIAEKVKDGSISKKRAQEFSKDITPEFMKFGEILLGRDEINADQVHVWVLNLSRNSLEQVNIGFQRCMGYVRHETEPVSQVASDKPAQNPTESARGIIYQHGIIKQEKSVFLKFGFNDIQECYVTVEAHRSDGGESKGKEVTGEEYTEYQDQSLYRRSIYFQYVIPILGFAVVLLIISTGIFWVRLKTIAKTT